MEDIIIWIVIVAIGATVEYLKGKRGSDSTSASKVSVTSTRNRQQHRPASQASPAPSKPEPYVPEPARNESWGEPIFTTAPAKQAKAKPKAKDGKPNRQDKTAPANTYRPLTVDSHPDPMDEGPSMQAAPKTDENRLRDEAEQARLKAHYSRWRQAILDTQVLERKF